MPAERLLSPATSDAPASPEVRAERKRVMDALTTVINDCLVEWESVGHPVAEALVRGFCRELVNLNRFVRQGKPLEEFTAARKSREPEEELPVAEELDSP